MRYLDVLVGGVRTGTGHGHILLYNYSFSRSLQFVIVFFLSINAFTPAYLSVSRKLGGILSEKSHRLQLLEIYRPECWIGDIDALHPSRSHRSEMCEHTGRKQSPHHSEEANELVKKCRDRRTDTYAAITFVSSFFSHVYIRRSLEKKNRLTGARIITAILTTDSTLKLVGIRALQVCEDLPNR